MKALKAFIGGVLVVWGIAQFVFCARELSNFENGSTHLTLGAACAGLVILLWEHDTKK